MAWWGVHENARGVRWPITYKLKFFYPCMSKLPSAFAHTAACAF
ncbi:protein of unknown function [Acidithiobacillus ferrivorans]|nr:protein of unknown function [Acidithiobacillus ferrivorans]